jgi:hypothetical protein
VTSAVLSGTFGRSVGTCLFRNTFSLLAGLVSTNFGTCSHQCSLPHFNSISLHTLSVRDCPHYLISLCIFLLPIFIIIIIIVDGGSGGWW